MQLTVFSTDNYKSGFRLQYMEVYNWGTFDEVVHCIRPMGETGLLTGSNGSGKTTFVDALLTLIVPEKRYRFYNQSSGSEKKGDRTEESYVLGGYTTMNSESTGTEKTLYLREHKEETYSILLANFANEADQSVTLFQVRYFVNGDMKRHYGIAHTSLHIETDFKPFDLGGNWKRALDQRYNKTGRKLVEWFDSATKYASQLVHVLGMQSIQALQLFNQTVGIKVLGNLDEFIRTNMLEPRNVEDVFQDLKKQLSTLLEAQRNIEKAEEQIKLLSPIQEHYKRYTEYQQSIKEVQQQLETAAIWNNFTKHELLLVAIKETASSLTDLQKKLQETKEKYERLQEEERIARNQIDQNKAGQRLQQLEKDIQDLEKEKKKTQDNLALFRSWCTDLHIEEKELIDEASYKQIKKDTHRKFLELSTKQRLNEDEEYEAKRLKEESESERKGVETELNNLLQGKNNIPAHLTTIRRLICEALNIDSAELPFAGELLQVKTEELSWQPVLEKLLHSFSLRLLVPERYYKKVNRYVNHNNLRARLVYELITDTALLQEPEAGTIHEKLDFHPDHPLSGWVEQQIIRQFDYACIEDEKTLERYDKAVTLNGLVKNRSRHEKDDRPDRNDPSRYVMGWNNEKKKEFLIRKRNQLADTGTKAEETLQKCKNKSNKLKGQFYAVSRIEEHTGFSELDITGIQWNIHKLKEQVDALRRTNKELDKLKEQLQEIQLEKEKIANCQKEYIGQEALLTSEIGHLRAQRETFQTLVSRITEAEKDILLQFQLQHAHVMTDLSLQNIDPIYEQIKNEKAALLERQKDFVHKEETQLNRCINKVKNPSSDLRARFSPEWEGDVQHLPEDALYASEYIDLLEKLTNENLPRYKKEFENYINDTITYKIGGLNEELERWEKDITSSVQKLNQSLSGINFNRLPDTYIQLGKRSVPAGTDIKEFRARLLEALPQAANWQQSPFEEKSLHFKQKVQPLVDELDRDLAYRTRVLDVRNWFEFWADEIYRNTNDIKKTYRQMGQLSGGEKAQLTYTILCSAIAYQFGITREGKNSRSLRFIAIDESFSNQDEDKANYLMELCKQLHLQLLVVTPSDKIQIVQDFIAHVHLVQRVNNRHSILYNMTILELKEKIQEALN